MILETLAVMGLKALFGKVVVGGAVKATVGVAAKGLIVHDVAQAVDALSNASGVSDLAQTSDGFPSDLARDEFYNDLWNKNRLG